MRLVFDGHIFRWQRTGGISRYFREIISRLPAHWAPTVLEARCPAANLPHHPRLVQSNFPIARLGRVVEPITRQWWHARYLGQDAVFHPTYYTLATGFDYTKIRAPIVVTAHDFIGARHPTLEFESGDVVRQQFASLAHASHVICVSHATERDLLHFVPTLQGRTSVIYHGSTFPIADTAPSEDVFSPPTFLFVGRRHTYKNFLFLLRAFARACRHDSRLRLHTAGPALSEEERWQIHFAGISDRVDSTVSPSDAQLRELYRRSVALLYPSRHEGFGIPALEAMACGTVVVTANATSLPEVVGDAGLLLDPADEEAWTDHILQIAAQRIDRPALIRRGFARAAQLTWDRSTQAHVALYERLLATARAPIAAPHPLRA